MDQRHLVIHVQSDNPVDAERLDEASQTLRSDLLDIDGVGQVTPVGEESPPGTKSLTYFALASLSVATGVSGRAIAGQIAKVMLGWLQRNDGKRITLRIPGRGEFDLAGLGEAEAVRVVESALEAAAAGPPTQNDLTQPQ
jgi:multidrug efflux pump subunit AcrB